MVLGMAVGVVLLATIQLAGIGRAPHQAETWITNWSAKGAGKPFTISCKLALGVYYTRYISAPPARPPPGKEICSTGSYQFAYSASVHAQAGPRSWQDVARLPCKYGSAFKDQSCCRRFGPLLNRPACPLVPLSGFQKTRKNGQKTSKNGRDAAI